MRAKKEMSSNNGDGEASVPLLESHHHHHHREEAEAKRWRWCNRVLDMKECKNQTMFSLPMIITNVSYYSIFLVSVMFAGHLGELELAGANLANSWATISGTAFMVGLSGALETLCGQGYGAKLYSMLGVYLQASCMLSFCFSIFLSIIWWYSETILISLQQDPQIAALAGLYLKYLIPALFAYGLVQNLLRFHQMQSIVKPLVVCSVIPLMLNVVISHALVRWTSLGFKGAAMAVSISVWISAFMLIAHVLYSKKFEHTWDGFSLESFCHIFTNLKLALPSIAMVCLEEWAFELLVLVAGLMPNSQFTTISIAMSVNTETIAYMIAYGLSATSSTRVSNELGAGNTNMAKHAMAVGIKLGILLALGIDLALGFGHGIWASLFSNSSTVKTEFASMMPLLIVSIAIDFLQGILSGVARGCGWQHIVVCINLVSYYFIGMPVSLLLGLKLELHAQGLWMGLICGLTTQACCLSVLACRNKWARLDLLTDNATKV